MLTAGARIPAVSGVLSGGGRFDFGAPSGAPLVLFFYPKAFTPTCTKEACGFRDAHEGLLGLGGARVLGISRDKPENNRRFKEQYRLPFELVSDEDGAIAKAFDVQLFGGLIPASQRVTFVIDGGGVVRGVFKNMFNAQLHVDEAKATLRELAGQRPA